MQIQLDPKQMDFLRRQAEAMEKIAIELAKLRKTSVQMHETIAKLAGVELPAGEEPALPVQRRPPEAA